MVLKLFFCAISPPCRAVKLALNALHLNVQYEDVDILTRKYLQTQLPKINPQHTVPTLVDGDAIIWDSHAINIYLVQKYAPDYSLYPADPYQRAIINQRLHFDSGLMYPCIYNSVVSILFKQMRNLNQHQLIAVKQIYAFAEKFLTQNEWIAGDKLTVADFSCMSSLSTLDYIFPVSSKTTPKLMRYLERSQDLPYYELANQEGLNQLGKLMQEKVLKASKNITMNIGN
ncbi:glutathione S-transferase 1-like [Onthophagus taurus]|uniref:glutathione S-transferase 1-like n=1 Tax=Onthophagus taurus TaxID=166361 RepID=UPI0039BDF537